MTVIYLEPGDLSTTETAQVLEFLNQAASAEELAQLIEFPNELDIGVRLGQRVLNARAAAGGAFTDLAQVAAVAYIGPERFTEICAAALGLDPSFWSGNFNPFSCQQQTITRDYSQLQSQLDSLMNLNGQVSLDLQCTTQPAWLGQPLELRLYVRDIAGRPLPNRRVTLEASLGLLEVAYGFAVQRAPAVELRTGADGSAHLCLYYIPQEPLTQEQQAALNQMLKQLDPTADSPHLLKPVFLQIASTYQQERQTSLQRALDIYAQEAKARFFNQLNSSNLGFHWPIETSVLRANYHPDDGSASSTAQAVATVHWKNWVGAWFEYLGDYLSGTAGLQQAFNGAKQRGAEGFRLVDDLLGEAHSFVANQQGLTAQWVSQRVVKYAVHDFLGQELEGLDETTQSKLFSYLEIASEQLQPGNRGTLAAVNQTRIELDTKIDMINSIDTGMLADMRSIQDEIMAHAGTVALAAETVENAKIAVEEKAREVNRTASTISAEITEVRGELTDFRTQRMAITRELDTVKTDMAKVKIDLQKIELPGGGG